MLFCYSALGAGVAIGANHVVKMTVGQSIDELAGNGVIKVGEGVENLGGYVGMSEEQAKLLEANKQAKASFKAPVPEVLMSKYISQSREQDRMQKKALAQSKTENLEKPTVAKGHVAQPALQATAKAVGDKIDHNLKNSSNVTPAVKQPNNGRSIS
jgi:hypothetical protein